ncbi:MAG: hypothetical protein V3R37_03740 [Rhodospirillales bacterium]
MNAGSYHVRKVAHFFAVVGFATVVYSTALLGIAFQSGIVEF